MNSVSDVNGNFPQNFPFRQMASFVKTLGKAGGSQNQSHTVLFELSWKLRLSYKSLVRSCLVLQ